MGIHSKEEIEAFGEEPFIQKCQQSVWRYMQEWQQLTRRLGFWVDLEQAYVTYHQSYVESVWWSLKNLFDRGLLYQGHKIVWWWAQGGTALVGGRSRPGLPRSRRPERLCVVSAGRPTQSLAGGLDDHALDACPATCTRRSIRPAIEYCVVKDEETGGELVMAKALVETIAGKLKRELKFIEDISRAIADRPAISSHRLPTTASRPAIRTGELVDGGSEHKYWRVVAADFVTTESGSGIVHQAPAFGEVDHDVLVDEQQAVCRRRSPRAAVRRRTGRKIHRRICRDEGHVGQGCRQAAHSRRCANRADCCIWNSTCTSIRSVGGPARIR